MRNLSHLMVLLTVFSFMLTMVNLLPSLVATVQARYKFRFGDAGRELDKLFGRVRAPHIMAASAALGLLAAVLSGSWVLGATLVVAGLFAPKAILLVWKDIRTRQFEAQLIDALILISNALKSGLDIATGIELVANEMKPPISEEFGVVLNSYRLGAPLEEALNGLTRRLQSRSLDTAVNAIIIQRETGGNLIKTFEQLVQTIREEGKLQRKVKALSAQGRTQIAFLAVFPWALAAVFYFLSPEMMQPALQNSWGQLTLVGLLVWEGIGLIVTKRIVTVDV